MAGLVQLLLHIPGLADCVAWTVNGIEVEEGNYNSYTLKHTGDVQLFLTSWSGDADMYVLG